MKPLNEKEINSTFFKTLVFYLIAALVLIVSAFLGIQISNVEDSTYKEYYDSNQHIKSNNETQISEYNSISDDLARLRLSADAFERKELEADLTDRIAEQRRGLDSTRHLESLLLKNFLAGVTFIEELDKAEEEYNELKKKNAELTRKYNDCKDSDPWE